MKPECPPLHISLKIKGADGRSWRRVESVYEEIPSRFSKKKFLTKGVFPSGLSPSFHTECLPSLLGSSSLNKREIQGLSSQLIPFSFPRPGIENRRRIAHLLNPIIAIQTALVLDEHWEIYRNKLAEKKDCLFETSIPVIDQEDLRYLRPALTHTKLSSLLENVHLRYPTLIKFDVQAFYPSIYTHSLEWAMVGKTAAKKKLSEKRDVQGGDQDVAEAYKAGQELDNVIRRGQDKETYGIPIGPDSSFIAAELVGKSVAHDLVHELKKSNLNNFFLIRHVDDFALFLYENVLRAIGTVRKVLRSWNLLPNELKIEVIDALSKNKDTWVYQLSSFSSDGKISELALSEEQSSIVKRDVVTYQEIDYWNLEHYLALAFDLQKSHPTKSVITYALRRLHLNSRVKPSKSSGDGYGRPYLMNFKDKFYPDLDLQLSALLSAFPQYVDVIADVYLWYHEIAEKTPSYLSKAIDTLIIDRLDALEHHFEILWLLWIARYFQLTLEKKSIITLLEAVQDPLTALELLAYAHFWQGKTDSSLTAELDVLHRRVSESKIGLQKAETLQEAFLREDWIFHYSLHFAPNSQFQSWAPRIDERESSLGPILRWMIENDVQFFRWDRHIHAADKLLGVSRKGRGGISARPYSF